jgi:hypothetical protein
MSNIEAYPSSVAAFARVRACACAVCACKYLKLTGNLASGSTEARLSISSFTTSRWPICEPMYSGVAPSCAGEDAECRHAGISVPLLHPSLAKCNVPQQLHSSRQDPGRFQARTISECASLLLLTIVISLLKISAGCGPGLSGFRRGR